MINIHFLNINGTDWGKILNQLTAVCINIALWSLICRTIDNGYTGWLASIKHIAVSMVIKTPVLPIPALKYGKNEINSLLNDSADKNLNMFFFYFFFLRSNNTLISIHYPFCFSHGWSAAPLTFTPYLFNFTSNACKYNNIKITVLLFYQKWILWKVSKM